MSAYWKALGQRAAQDLFAWSAFVSRTEFLWQDGSLVKDADAWQRVWFEMEIINGLALAEWEDQGRPAQWSSCWAGSYQEQARELAGELVALILDPPDPHD